MELLRPRRPPLGSPLDGSQVRTAIAAPALPRVYDRPLVAGRVPGDRGAGPARLHLDLGGCGGQASHATLLTVRFAEQGAKTKLTLHQAAFETVTSRDGHQDGWTSSLDRLDEYLAK
ncbi:MAG: SRPBCC domain-containing protein [Deltaproteobacteria bacterium]|nr:MAG: SRPBCC domain-containing protein [Deltaproteobacteria bacterium]TMB18185.1 MAG: SRPBCC domain-containing protein [Deltaproteobacteria bacterium]